MSGLHMCLLVQASTLERVTFTPELVYIRIYTTHTCTHACTHPPLDIMWWARSCNPGAGEVETEGSLELVGPCQPS